MAKNISVYGIYPDRTTVSDAIDTLYQARYRTTDIAVLMPENQGSKDLAHVKGSKAPEGAAIGAAAGAVAGVVLAWLVAIGVLVIPGSEPLVSSGRVIAALAGAGGGGALGWVIGFLIGMGRPAYEAKRYAGRVRRGGILLSVHCDGLEWRDRAKKILRDTGAQNIASASESAADYGTTDKPTERGPVGSADRGVHKNQSHDAPTAP